MTRLWLKVVIWLREGPKVRQSSDVSQWGERDRSQWASYMTGRISTVNWHVEGLTYRKKWVKLTSRNIRTEGKWDRGIDSGSDGMRPSKTQQEDWIKHTGIYSTSSLQPPPCSAQLIVQGHPIWGSQESGSFIRYVSKSTASLFQCRRPTCSQCPSWRGLHRILVYHFISSFFSVHPMFFPFTPYQISVLRVHFGLLISQSELDSVLLTRIWAYLSI